MFLINLNISFDLCQCLHVTQATVLCPSFYKCPFCFDSEVRVEVALGAAGLSLVVVAADTMQTEPHHTVTAGDLECPCFQGAPVRHEHTVKSPDFRVEGGRVVGGPAWQAPCPKGVVTPREAQVHAAPVVPGPSLQQRWRGLHPRAPLLPAAGVGFLEGEEWRFCRGSRREVWLWMAERTLQLSGAGARPGGRAVKPTGVAEVWDRRSSQGHHGGYSRTRLACHLPETRVRLWGPTWGLGLPLQLSALQPGPAPAFSTSVFLTGTSRSSPLLSVAAPSPRP